MSSDKHRENIEKRAQAAKDARQRREAIAKNHKAVYGGYKKK